MAKPRLKQHDKKQCVTYQIVAIDTQSRREQDRCIQGVGFYNPPPPPPPPKYIFVALLKQVAQLAAAVCDISKGARGFQQIGINLQLKFEF
uniref:Ribosomal protein S16 n=1 Tax=Goniophlebium amoenum TaxID=253745 RepID=A0A8E7MJ11_9MONI|nr:ribosomal protein S16 [Goniophlebium amoenum]